MQQEPWMTSVNDKEMALYLGILMMTGATQSYIMKTWPKDSTWWTDKEKISLTGELLESI
jgi:hypothetical protein